MSDPPKDVTINAVDDSIGCLAKPCGTFYKYIKHRLKISWRTGDDMQDLTRGSLLLQSFSDFPL